MALHGRDQRPQVATLIASGFHHYNRELASRQVPLIANAWVHGDQECEPGVIGRNGRNGLPVLKAAKPG